MISLDFLARVDAQGNFVAEGCECAGIDSVPCAAAPRDEGVRANVRLDSANPLLLQALFRLLRSTQFAGEVSL